MVHACPTQSQHHTASDKLLNAFGRTIEVGRSQLAFVGKFDSKLQSLYVKRRPVVQVVAPNEFVVVQGQKGNEMFFVKTGTLEIRQSKTLAAVETLSTASSHFAQSILKTNRGRDDSHASREEHLVNNTKAPSTRRFFLPVCSLHKNHPPCICSTSSNVFGFCQCRYMFMTP